MSDLRMYHDLRNEIERLELLVKSQKDAVNNKLTLTMSELKIRFASQQAAEQKTINTAKNLIILSLNGRVDLCVKDIAEICGISVPAIYKYRQDIKASRKLRENNVSRILNGFSAHIKTNDLTKLTWELTNEKKI